MHFDRLKPCPPNLRIDEKDVPQDSVVPPAEAPPQTRREGIQLLDDEASSRGCPTNAGPWWGGGGGGGGGGLLSLQL